MSSTKWRPFCFNVLITTQSTPTAGKSLIVTKEAEMEHPCLLGDVFIILMDFYLHLLESMDSFIVVRFVYTRVVRVVKMPTFSSLEAPEVVITAPCGATSDNEVGIMTADGFQCIYKSSWDFMAIYFISNYTFRLSVIR